MPPITILRQYHQSELDAGGNVVRMVRVDFKVGDDGPFNVSILERDYNADTLLARVRSIADEVVKLRESVRTLPG